MTRHSKRHDRLAYFPGAKCLFAAPKPLHTKHHRVRPPKPLTFFQKQREEQTENSFFPSKPPTSPPSQIKLAFPDLPQQYIDSVESFLVNLHSSLPPTVRGALSKYYSPDTPLVDLLPQILLTSGIVITTLLTMRKFFNNMTGRAAEGADDSERTEDVIYVKHGKNDYEFKFPLGAISGGAVTVGALRAKAAQETGVEAGRISLVGLGRNLKDDSATLRSLGMGNATKVLCMASQQKPLSTKKPTAVAPVKILGPMEKIEAVKQAVHDKTGAMVQDYVTNTPSDAKEREDAHRKISETIMGEILKLDGIESDDPDVRVRRKEVVKEIQRTLESVDAALKKAGSSL